jgi:hypothetical protein
MHFVPVAAPTISTATSATRRTPSRVCSPTGPRTTACGVGVCSCAHRSGCTKGHQPCPVHTTPNHTPNTTSDVLSTYPHTPSSPCTAHRHSSAVVSWLRLSAFHAAMTPVYQPTPCGIPRHCSTQRTVTEVFSICCVRLSRSWLHCVATRGWEARAGQCFWLQHKTVCFCIIPTQRGAMQQRGHVDVTQAVVCHRHWWKLMAQQQECSAFQGHNKAKITASTQTVHEDSFMKPCTSSLLQRQP